MDCKPGFHLVHGKGKESPERPIILCTKKVVDLASRCTQFDTLQIRLKYNSNSSVNGLQALFSCLVFIEFQSCNLQMTSLVYDTYLTTHIFATKVEARLVPPQLSLLAQQPVLIASLKVARCKNMEEEIWDAEHYPS